jgi:hypothetical protein
LYSSPNVNSGDQVKKVEVGGTCTTYAETRNTYRILLGNMKERDHSEDLMSMENNNNNNNNKVNPEEIGWEGVDWINMAEDRDNLWAVMITVMNLGFRKMQVIFLNS